MPEVGRVRYVEALPAVSRARARGTLVLLHAFPLNARMWEPQLVLAEDGWRIIAPHVRGADGAHRRETGADGAGDDPPVRSIDDYAADLVDLLDGLHVDDAVIGGLSMGGYITFALLRRAPNYVRALILADTRPQPDTPEGIEGRKRMLKLVAEKGPPAVADELVPKLLGETTRRRRPDIVQRVRSLALENPAESVAGSLRALMSRPDSTPVLRSVRIPTLIVVGEEDAVTPPEVSHAMQQIISGAELVVIPEAGHLSSLEQPDAFNAALAGFLGHRV